MLLWEPLFMTYDTPLWAFEGEVISEVANFKEECLVAPEGGEGEKEIILERAWNARMLTTTLTGHSYTWVQNVWHGWPVYVLKCLCSR